MGMSAVRRVSRVAIRVLQCLLLLVAVLVFVFGMWELVFGVRRTDDPFAERAIQEARRTIAWLLVVVPGPCVVVVAVLEGVVALFDIAERLHPAEAAPRRTKHVVPSSPRPLALPSVDAMRKAESPPPAPAVDTADDGLDAIEREQLRRWRAANPNRQEL